MAAVRSDQGRLEESLALHIDTLERQRRILGPTHPNTIQSIGNLAVLHRKMDNVADALEFQLEAVALTRE